MAYTLNIRCLNCGNIHPRSSPKESPECLLFHVRARSGRLSPCAQGRKPVYSFAIPADPSLKTALRASLWAVFDEQLKENERQRSLVMSNRRKEEARIRDLMPLIWVQWRSDREKHGQTRNRQNFETLWENLVERPCDMTGDRVVWISIVLSSPLESSDAFRKVLQTFAHYPSWKLS